MKIQTGSQLRIEDLGSVECPTCGEIVPLGIAEDTNTYTAVHCSVSIKVIPLIFTAVVDKITEQNIESILEYNTLEEDEDEDEDDDPEVNHNEVTYTLNFL